MRRVKFSSDFIVRVYRSSGKDRYPFVGVVQKVGVEKKMAFTTYDELWEILTALPTDHQENDANA